MLALGRERKAVQLLLVAGVRERDRESVCECANVRECVCEREGEKEGVSECVTEVVDRLLALGRKRKAVQLLLVAGVRETERECANVRM